MALVDVVIAQCVDEFAGFQFANVRNQMGQQRIRAYVERHAKECVGGTLIELAVQDAFLLYLELKQRVTWRQIYLVPVSRIPATDDQAARVWIRFDLVYQTRDLIYAIAFWIVPTERTPKITVDWTEVARLATESSGVFFIRPFLPNIDAFCAQVGFVCVAGKKPKQFFRDPAKGNSLCRNNGKAFAQIKARLITEMRDRTDTRAVLMFSAVFEDRAKDVVVLLHKKEHGAKGEELRAKSDRAHSFNHTVNLFVTGVACATRAHEALGREA